MQSTIFFLQQELKQAKDTILTLESELNTVRTSNDNNGYTTSISLTNDYDKSVDDSCDNDSAQNTTIVNGQSIKSELDVNNKINENILSERTSLNNGIKHNNNSSVVLNSERTTNKIYCNGEIDDGSEIDTSIDDLNGELVKESAEKIEDDIKIHKSATVTKIKCNEQINDNLSSSNLSNYICKTNESTDTIKLTISLPKRQRSNNYDSDSSEYSSIK